jgi:hypothetical protein
MMGEEIVKPNETTARNPGKTVAAGLMDRLWSVEELIEAATGEEYAQQSA